MLTDMLEKNLSTELLEEEQKCLQYLQVHHPQLVPHFLNKIQSGRRGILFKLAAALLREDIIGLYSSSITLKKIGSVFVIGLVEVTESWEGLFRHLQKMELREDISYRIYSFDQRWIIFPIEKEYGFGRIVLTDNILLITEENTQIVETARNLLSILGHKLPEQARILQSELDNGTANYTFALSYFEQWKKEIQREADTLNAQTVIDYARMKKERDRFWNSSLFFEQFSIEGHQLHPGAKTKTGMSPKDVFRFSPEFQQSQSICFVAVRKDHLLVIEAQPNYIEFAFSSIHDPYQTKMRTMGYSPEDYRLLPVHEWQYKHAIPNIYSKEIDTGVVLLLDDLSIEGAASSSFRTIWPQLKGKPALKLAVNSQMTSTIRSISTQTAMNSLKFTNLIKSILNKEPSLERFLPINELAGYSFRSNRKDQSRNLTVVVRESMDEKLKTNELAITGSSLYSISPVSEKTILIELVEEYCHYHKLGKNEGAVSFLKDYLSIIIPGFLTLLVKYGVALEGHLQNSVPVFKDGKPVRFYFRDWGGARVYEKRLRQQGITMAFYPESVSLTQDEQELRNKAYYTLFQNHLGEFIVQLCQYSGLPEKDLWKEVRKACDESFTLLQKQGIEWAKMDAEYLYTPLVDHKALAKMRLYPENGYCYSYVSNPLYIKEMGK